MTSDLTKKPVKIPIDMLQHLEYLRGLHLDGPKIGNVYLQDTALREYIAPILGQNKQFQQLLISMGDKLSTQYIQASRNAQQNQPWLQQFDSYGKRIDKLHLSSGWQKQKKYAAEDGIVALSYEVDQYRLGQMQRLGQLINLYLYLPSSGLFGCPLAMTDGATYIIRHILESEQCPTQTRNLLRNAYQHLTSRTEMWTSGQWMTEKKGGSDVSNTETVAVLEEGNNYYRLYGYKWFTSATDSQISLALAKILPKGVKPTVQNIRGIKLRNDDGTLNNMEVIRLKDKLGTRQLPTAELLLKGTVGYLISAPESGVKMISKMLTITRIYNSATAIGVIGRGLALARDYASRRVIGKTTLSNMPLQLRVLSNLEVIHRGCLVLYLKLGQLFSKQQFKSITHHEANVLRVMVPLMKLFTAKQSLVVSTQVLQSFGGMGYIQSSMLPSILRDTQVLSIWQGTTNVLCYDFLRALFKKQNQFMPIQSIVLYFMQNFQHAREKDHSNNRVVQIFKKIIQGYTELFNDINQAIKQNFNGYLAELRCYCFGLTRVFIAVELMNHMLITLRQKDIEVVERWINLGLYHRQKYNNKMDKQLGMNLNQKGVSCSSGDFDCRGIARSKL